MYYSNKMKWVSLTFYILSFVFLIISIFLFWAPTPGGSPNFLALIILGFSLLMAINAAAFQERSVSFLIKNIKSIRSKIRYCYSCGFDLNESTTADICPKCNSKLNLRDLIDS